MNQLDRYYLHHMGVDAWEIRRPVTETTRLCDIQIQANDCTKCILHKTRTKVVFSRGNPSAKLVIIGEAPGYHEDLQGHPFVGKAGSLLDKMLQSIGLSEGQVYITNVIKCRPPNNRDPKQEEINTCGSYLTQQLTAIQPDLLLALGRFAGQFIVGKPLTMAKLRTQVHDYQGIPCVVTYHPAYLLRKLQDKKKAYQDLRQVSVLLSKGSA